MKRLRRWFLSGLVVVVPLVVTWLVLKWLFQTIDGILGPALVAMHGKPLPGLGIVATLLIILVAGWIATGVAGGRLIRLWESLLARIPLIRMVYSAAKQVLESVSREGGPSFQQVGLVEYPRTGMYSVCFIANRVPIKFPDHLEPRITVFVPTTPTPFTGNVVLVKPEDVILLDLSVEDAVKLVVSGGIVVPGQFLVKTSGVLA
jgi:uncharacterized membrane protein